MTRHAAMRLLVWASLVVFAVACGSKASPIQQHEGATVYTQVGMWAEEGRHHTTNYSRGVHLPVNTRVVIEETSSETIVFRVPDIDLQVTMINAADHTQKDIGEIYNQYFGNSQVDLSGFSATERDAIENGEIEQGMSKQAVLVARGHPPAHATPSTDMDTWTYWRHRFGRNEVHFENGRVSEIK